MQLPEPSAGQQRRELIVPAVCKVAGPVTFRPLPNHAVGGFAAGTEG